MDYVPRWIIELDDMGWNKHTCPNCGYVKRTDIHVKLGWNYCPICGEQLDGNLKEGYCPICDKTINVYSDDSMCDCPTCGHNVCLHELDKE